MNVVLIVGDLASGKMTVGRELAKITNYPLLHRSCIAEPVIDVFGEFDYGVADKIREVFLNEIISRGSLGVILTFNWAFDSSECCNQIEEVVNKFESVGANIFCVELYAPQNIRVQRVKSNKQSGYKLSKSTPQSIVKNEFLHRYVSYSGEVPFKEYIKFDTSNMTAERIAVKVKELFNL